MIDIAHAQSHNESQDITIQCIDNDASEQILLRRKPRGRPRQGKL